MRHSKVLSKEQAFVEKLRSLLIFGPNSRRYKDIFDMYYLKDKVDDGRLLKIIEVLILSDKGMKEENVDDIVLRMSTTFANEQYISRLSNSRQRWMDEDINTITSELLSHVTNLKAKAESR